jgi:DNA helicase INO80
VQSISLLSYLAETHDIWGPFLVVAPASTLHNWQQELTRFVPGLKALPYWGNVKDRATLRKFWSKKEISYNQDAPFHVLITSYQLVSYATVPGRNADNYFRSLKISNTSNASSGST